MKMETAFCGTDRDGCNFCPVQVSGHYGTGLNGRRHSLRIILQPGGAPVSNMCIDLMSMLWHSCKHFVISLY